MFQAELFAVVASSDFCACNHHADAHRSGRCEARGLDAYDAEDRWIGSPRCVCERFTPGPGFHPDAAERYAAAPGG